MHVVLITLPHSADQFTAGSGENCKGSIPLSIVLTVDRCEKRRLGPEFPFLVTTSSDDVTHNFELAAASENELDEWLEAFDVALSSSAGKPNRTLLSDPSGTSCSHLDDFSFIDSTGEQTAMEHACVGSGGTAKVYRVQYTSREGVGARFGGVRGGEVYAMKVMSKRNQAFSPELLQNLTEEQGILHRLRALQHPNILQMHHVFDRSDSLHLVLDLCECDMWASIEKAYMESGRRHGFAPDQARRYAGELARALQALHELGYIHCDLKMEVITDLTSIRHLSDIY